MVNPAGRAGAGVDLGKMKEAIRQFSQEWPDKPESAKGRKESIKSSMLELNVEIKLLMSKGYTPANVVAALAAMGMKVSLNTVKSAFREIKASEEALKEVQPKAKKPRKAAAKAANKVNTGLSANNQPTVNNVSSVKPVTQSPTTAGASKSRSKDV